MAIERLKSESKIATDGFAPKIPCRSGLFAFGQIAFSVAHKHLCLALYIFWSLLEISGGNRCLKQLDFGRSTLVYYVRKTAIVEFENPPPTMRKVLSALT